jgi:hypothetical protein
LLHEKPPLLTVFSSVWKIRLGKVENKRYGSDFFCFFNTLGAKPQRIWFVIARAAQFRRIKLFAASIAEDFARAAIRIGFFHAAQTTFKILFRISDEPSFGIEFQVVFTNTVCATTGFPGGSAILTKQSIATVADYPISGRVFRKPDNSNFAHNLRS